MIRYKPISIPSKTTSPKPILINDFLGIDLNNDPTVIDNRRAVDMLNMIPDSSGILNKRTGYSKVYTNAIGTNKPIRGLFLYRKTDGTEVRILSCNQKLYTWDDTGNAPVEIYSGVADADMNSFQMNGKIYFQDGTNYLQYDGTTVTAPTPYIPTLTKGRAPTGGGSAFEQFNLLGAGFKDSFSSTGVATVYTLSLTGLDATAVTCTINGVAKTEGTHFTVNRTAGTIDFSGGTSPHGAPAAGTDNVIITAYKTISGYADRIKKCRFNAIFGGANDTRVFVSGNPDSSWWNVDWRSGLSDPTYFPDNGFVKIGKDSEKITGYSKQFDYLIIFKEDSTWTRTYSTDSTGLAIFPLKPLSDSIGCIATKSIAIINNNPIILSKKGVFMLQSGQVRDERNYIHQSFRVDPRLLEESNLENAVAIDFNNKYHLAINGNVYVLDYRNMTEPDQNNMYGSTGEWYPWNNVDTFCFFEYNNYLYFGSSTIGMVYKFKKENDTNAYQDVDSAIECYWYSKNFSMDSHRYKKNVDKVFITLQPDNKTSADLYYISDMLRSDLIDTIGQYLFSYTQFNYTHFNYLTNRFPQTERNKIKAKKIIYFQIILKNNNLAESMGIQAIEIHYSYVSEVK